MLKRFLRDESGVTAIEYGLIAAGIFLAVVTAIGVFTDSTNTMLGKIQTAVTSTSGS